MYPTPFVAGNQLPASDLNDYTLNPSVTYGETIAANKALHIKSDGKAYLLSADTFENNNGFIGVSAEAGVLDDTKHVLGMGKTVTGVSGLTPNAPVYAGAAGAVTSTPGAYPLMIGWALNATTFIIIDQIALQFLSIHNGDGSDGDITFDGSTDYAGFSSRSGSVYTLTRDVFGKTVTINNGVEVKAAGYMVFATRGIFVNGTWSCDGGAGGNGSGATGGAAGSAGGGGTAGVGAAGGAGANAPSTAGNAGTNVTEALGGAGGAGGGSGSAAGGAGGTSTQTTAKIKTLTASELMVNPATLTKLKGGAGGGGGGSGNGGAVNSGGGGGGGGGGNLWGSSPVIEVGATGIIRANGGNGGNGAGASNDGGGGTGGGGSVLLRCRSYMNAGTVQANAGATVGSGHTSGSNGSLGSAGQVLILNLF